MLFNSWAYVCFLPIVLALYWLGPRRMRLSLLLVASAVFYGWWDWRFLFLMALSIVVDYYAALKIQSHSDDKLRKRWLIASVATNLTILGVFKYFDFFSRSTVRLLAGVGWEADPFLLAVALPVGISFYTFQSMSYTIDVYRGRIPATPSFIEFAVYVSFFPQLVAGPIERGESLLPQVQQIDKVNGMHWKLAIYRISWGFYKKVVVADHLAQVVRLTLDGELTAGSVVVGSVAFAFQIFCDFSAYTDIARGSANLLGIELRPNFLNPYFATSPSDFWRRWHVSLSTWLRDYLYIPLGGNRFGTWGTYRNLALTMLLGGLWHGAAWTFVIWGAYHGGLLVAYRLAFGRRGQPKMERWYTRGAAMLLMFIFTLIGWLIFRAKSVGHLAGMTSALVAGDWSTPAGSLRDVLWLSSLVFAMMVMEEIAGEYDIPPRWGLTAWFAICSFFLGAVALFGATGGTEFIYFQF